MGHSTIQTNLLNDLTFKKLFASEETKHITQHFLQDVIQLNVTQIELKPSEVYSAKKLSDLAKENDLERTRVDLLLHLEDKQVVTLELQNIKQAYFNQRALFYMAKAYVMTYNSDNERSKYESLRSIYGVNILNFKLHPDDIPDAVIDYRFKNDKYNLTLQDKTFGHDLWTLIYFELPKVSASSDRLIQEWHSLFMTGTVSDEAPDYLKQAVAFINFENLDEEERAMYINFNEREAIRFAELDAAIQDGIEQGIERGTIMVAKNLMNNGMSIEMIMQVTGLNKEVLEAIAHE